MVQGPVLMGGQVASGKLFEIAKRADPLEIDAERRSTEREEGSVLRVRHAKVQAVLGVPGPEPRLSLVGIRKLDVLRLLREVRCDEFA